MPVKVTYQNPGLEYDENMVCEHFLNTGMLPLEYVISYLYNMYIYIIICIGYSYSQSLEITTRTQYQAILPSTTIRGLTS